VQDQAADASRTAGRNRRRARRAALRELIG
jgi:hypothetical protein